MKSYTKRAAYKSTWTQEEMNTYTSQLISNYEKWYVTIIENKMLQWLLNKYTYRKKWQTHSLREGSMHISVLMRDGKDFQSLMQRHRESIEICYFAQIAVRS